jgi:hypothetical protein
MRKIIIGKNSKLFKNYSVEFTERFDFFLSHTDIERFKFESNDCVLLLSYPNSKPQLDIMKNSLLKLTHSKVIILSTCAVIVSKLTNCYFYPKIKLLQEKYVAEVLNNFLIYRVGTIVRERDYNKYIGTCVLDSKVFFNELDSFIKFDFEHRIITSVKTLDFEGGTIEKFIYKNYCFLISTLSFCPCILRPLDLILRIFGRSWYGYGALTRIMMEKTSKHDL